MNLSCGDPKRQHVSTYFRQLEDPYETIASGGILLASPQQSCPFGSSRESHTKIVHVKGSAEHESLPGGHISTLIRSEHLVCDHPKSIHVPH
jgi:hypothetical protein